MSARQPLRVAIVGVGPAGAYAAEHLLRCGEDVQVELFDRLPTPWGLVRSGVAPDHQNTKGVIDQFAWTAADSRVRLHLHTEIGTDITHVDLAALHHAVVYATGAPHSRSLGIAGEDLPGSMGAAEFVAWYNGHPEFAGLEVNLSHDRVVIVGNGNVALDIARILTLPVERLRCTDIADHALEALAQSRIREVVVVGRRGPEQAAFTTPELLGLQQTGSGLTSCRQTPCALRRQIRNAATRCGPTPPRSRSKPSAKSHRPRRSVATAASCCDSVLFRLPCTAAGALRQSIWR